MEPTDVFSLASIKMSWQRRFFLFHVDIPFTAASNRDAPLSFSRTAAWTGCPHCGQAAAWLETCRPQAGQGMMRLIGVLSSGSSYPAFGGILFQEVFKISKNFGFISPAIFRLTICIFKTYRNFG
jgi:hypothetical protein